MKRLRLVMVFMLLTGLFACGGGGGDGTSSEFLGGVYSGIVRLGQDTCGLQESRLAITWTVNQADLAIVIDAAPSGDTFEGNVTSNDSFQATKRSPLDRCTSDTTIRVQNITSNSATTNISLVFRCNDGSRCEVGYSGSLKRVT